jgi:cation diffusion facilitator CzcD-associated flavoprotein CzcO
LSHRSSGIQILPAIRSQASKITTFIRSPTWVVPIQGFEQRYYSEEERREFGTNPDALLKHRKLQESGLNASFPLFISDSDIQKAYFKDMTEMMKARLQNETLEQLVIPKWGVGCRRLTPGVNYLETLVSEKVNAVYGNIQHITERGCVCDDGKEYPVDVLICATGFDTSFRPRFPIIGLGGKNLADEWADEPKSYLGLAASGFPNYFMFIGPNSPIGNGPVLAGMGRYLFFILIPSHADL